MKFVPSVICAIFVCESSGAGGAILFLPVFPENGWKSLKTENPMDIVWIILGAVCLLLGLGGCFLPALPGPPLAYVGMWLLHITDRVQFTVTQLVIWAILVIVVQVLDYFTPLIGTKYGGGSKWGDRGCIVGTVIGMFVFPPWGVILGPLVGAIVGELLGGKLTHEAFKAGLGAFLGFLLGVVIKVSLCAYFIYVFVAALV